MTRPARSRSVALLALSLACVPAVPACLGAQTARAAAGGAAFLRPCTVAATPARCGSYEVWENRATARGRKVALNVVVLVADDAAPRPDPLYVLAGGPGEAATGLAEAMARALQAVRRHRDVVLVDQRGTGGSDPLTCAGGIGVLDAGPDAVRACADELSRRADLAQYTTDNAADDLDEVRAALGHGSVNLLGVSYGTRLAQVYLRRHPAHVRTVTLRAVAPMGYNIPADGAREAERALRRLLEACAADPACAAAFPRLAAEMDSVAETVARTPARVRVPRPGGDSVEVVLDRGLLFQTLYALLLGPTRQLVPLLVHRAATGGLGVLAPVAARVRAAVYESLPVGMYLSVVCAEDVPWLSAGARDSLATTFGGISGGLVAACRAWPHATLLRDFLRPVAWAGPALLVSGDADPATSADRAEALARGWPGARHVVLPATAHGPMFPGCMQELVGEFIERASAAGLDLTCLQSLHWEPFATGRPGP